MKKYKWYGIVLFFVLLAAQPVTAWHADVSLSGPQEPQCPRCDFYTYTIEVNSGQWAEHVLRVIDPLPEGLEYIPDSSVIEPASADVKPQWETSTKILIWDFTDVQKETSLHITFKVRPKNLTPEMTSIKNTAETRVMPLSNWEDERWGHVISNTVTTTFSEGLCADPPVPVPEFPTIALPAAFIVGLLGVVLFIQRTKEH